MTQPTVTIRQTVLIPAPPAKVYAALLEPKLHEHFTHSKATGSNKVGATFTAWDGYINGKHLRLTPSKTIVQEWKTTDWPDGLPASVLTITLAKDKKGTLLRLIQTGVPKAGVKAYSEGWHDFYWKPLKAYFLTK